MTIWCPHATVATVVIDDQRRTTTTRAGFLIECAILRRSRQ
ncbi:MAG: hypothetical protein ABR578_13050 [Chromatocurvus sp.]